MSGMDFTAHLTETAVPAAKASMESATDLASALSVYKEQLEQVNRLLLLEPSNAEYVQVGRPRNFRLRNRAASRPGRQIELLN